jgi:lon-related putative ATP-dependent protease
MHASPDPVKEGARVPPEELRWTCPLDCLDFETTDRVTPVEGTIGQDRALKALKVGLELYGPGYNIYVAGLVGTGRSTTVKELLDELSPRCQVPRDRAYVMNFADRDRPRLITLAPGEAIELKKDMEQLVKEVRSRLPSAIEDKEVVEQREAIVRRFGDASQKDLEEFQAELGEEGLALVTVQAGPVPRPDIFPIHDGDPIPLGELEKLVEAGQVPEESLEAVREKIETYKSELREHLRKGREVARKMTREIESLFRAVGAAVIDGELEDLREAHSTNEAVGAFLDEARGEILDNLAVIAAAGEDSERSQVMDQFFKLFAVNVVSDHSKTVGCPVVVAQNPTHTSLFGTIEREMESSGVWRTDHTMIKGGALLEADGGYLILYALDVLRQPGVWQTLVRALKSDLLEIGLPEIPFLGMTTGMKPESIELNVKVVLIGEPVYYYLLHAQDPDFRKIFKVKADFTPDMDLVEQNLEHFAKVIARICEKEGLKPLSREAIGRLAEAGVRAAGRRDKITTRFADVADVVREAAYWCDEDGEDVIKQAHVQRAVDERRYRRSLTDSRMQELMEKDLLVIRTDGEAVGQVNGLSVMSLGDYAFGKPTLITAATSAGRSGIINIEREARLSGGIYDKGVLIISGFLRRLFAQERPLALTASLCFEQSYAGVDGDSASIAEIFALLSELSGIPIDQRIAVTGSINQRGEIQPVGGVNEKVEGFFGLCKARGLTGSQGVILPRRNVLDLMLRKEVVEAVENGEFSVWAVSSVDEGIEILSGVPAGARGPDGLYPEGTVFRAVEDKLEGYLDALRGRERSDWKPLVEVPGSEPPRVPEPTLPTAPDPRPGGPEGKERG